MSTREGPQLAQLTRRLAQCPAELLDAPRVGNSGRVHVAAVVGDVLHRWGHVLTPAEARAFQSADAKSDRNRLQLVLLGAWLLNDPALASAGISGASALEFLTNGVQRLALHVSSARLMDDEDRREELARAALDGIGLRPQGESEAQAHDRLLTISSAERQRVMEASRAAEERARKIREELARQRAQESADKWNRE